MFQLSFGFERMKRLDDPTLKTRVGHDYDQDLIEPTAMGRFYNGVRKKIIVVTHIDSSVETGVYERAFRSAIGSQFNSFVYEIK